ncbi:unnamed protein product [Mucor circinelloides]
MFTELSHLSYDLTVCLLSFLVYIFFREVRPRGSHRIPKEGPVIFVVAPHANQFVDPLLVMKECGRRTSMLIAEKSMHQRGVGTFARMLNAIPVIRPQDLATKGKGTVSVSGAEGEHTHISGTGTEFTKQLFPKDTLVLVGPHTEGCKAEVVQVISDTELVIKHPFRSTVSLENEQFKYKCIPHVEQSSVFKSVHEELNRGGCITIFPEGGSHDRVEMLPLKAGVTLMALGAMAQYPGLNVKIVPVGLNYFHAHRFRSRAVVEFGEPLTISERYVEMFKNGGEEKRLACGTLLGKIYDSLKSVTLNAESYETLMLIQAARRLYKPANRKLHISQVVDLNRRFLIGYNMFKDEPKVKELEQRVLAYNQLLKYHGIRDHQVQKTKLGGKRTLYLIFKRFIIMTLLALLDFPGAILNLPVIVIARVISQKKADAALKGSSVKVAGRDVLATWKLLVGLVLVPSLYSFYSFVVFLVLFKTTSFDITTLVRISIATWFTIAAVTLASLQFGEIGLDIAKSLKPMIVSVLDPSGAETLRQNREVLSVNITNLINEYGPKAFPDFDADYISKMKVAPTPVASRSSSSSSFNLTNVKLPTIFHQNKVLDTLQDHHLFNWSYNRVNSDEHPGFLGIGHYFTRSGATTPTLQGGSSRSSSFSAATNIDEDPLAIPSIRIEDVYHITKD